MLAHYLSPLALGFAAFRLGIVALALLGTLLLWRRPRPVLGLALVLAVHAACAVAYLLPLERPYALDPGTDRSFSLGMIACVAEGGSAFEHTQAGFSSPEPLWNRLVAALALHRIDAVPAVYDALAPVSVLVVGLCIYLGFGRGETGAWERALMAFSVLGLASLSMSPHPPVAAFFMGNFLLKPHHAIALGLVAVIAGRAARPGGTLLLGMLLGLLAWMFLLDWAYLLAVLLLDRLLRPAAERDFRGFAGAAALSLVVAAPYLGHLARDYAPGQTHAAATHMWNDPRGLPLAVPNWSTLDTGPLLVLAVVGAWTWWRRRTPADRTALATLAGAVGLFLLSVPASLLGWAPEPDELHYFLRFAMALAAGAALAAAARHLESVKGLRPGQGHVLALAAAIPLSFAAYWDPPNMDRYYPMSRSPIGPKVSAYARWIRDNTKPGDVFVAGRHASAFIPALAGRRVLLAEAGRLLPRDHAERKQAERILLTSEDADLVRRTAARFGVTHVAIDEPLQNEYAASDFTQLARSAAHRGVFANSAVRIVEVR
jgi:hypothetical protein